MFNYIATFDNQANADIANTTQTSLVPANSYSIANFEIDTTAKAVNADKITDCTSYMKQLVADGKQATLLEARGKEQLYKVLANCYKLYLQLEVDKDEQLKTAYKDYLKQRGFTFGNSTKLLNKILYAVFCNAANYNNERKRISAYATALTAMALDNVECTDVVKTINNSNGIEGLRKKASSKNTVNETAKISAVDKQYAASTALSKQQLFTLDVATSSVIAVGTQVGNLIVLIGTRQQDGSIVINTAECNNKLIDSVRENYYDTYLVDKAKSNSKQITDKASVCELIKTFEV